VAALLLGFTLLYVLPLGVRPIASPDEVRYGTIAREMLVSGDWISPHFTGVRYFEKPVLGYWLSAASFAVLGESPFALRLPVVLATALTALIVLALARRYLTRFAARLAAAIFLTTFLVAGVGTFAVLDAYLALFLTAALASFYLAIEAEQRLRRHVFLELCGAACAAAFLVKGFLALAIPVLVAGPYLVARRRWRTLATSPWEPIAVAAALILPWAVAIGLREPDFWRYFFWVEHVRRFIGHDAQHAAPFWYYLAWLPLTGWPWIALLPAALIGLRTAASTRSGAPAFLWYAAAWAALPFLFLSLSKGKLLTYLLPCFAPLSILLAAGHESYFRGPGRRALRAGIVFLAAVFLLALAAVAAAQTGLLGNSAAFGPAERAKLAILVGCFVLGAGALALGGFGRARGPVLAAVAIAGGALILPLQVAPPQRLLEHVAPAATIARYADASSDTLVVADGSLFGTAAWVLRRSDVYVLGGSEIDYGLAYPGARKRRLDPPGLARLIGENRGRHSILILCKASTDAAIERLLPPSARRERHGEVVLSLVPAHSSPQE
jgi:4-amino-4-deoxy-L-arabinose transferase